MPERVGLIGKQSERIVNLMLQVQSERQEQLDHDKDNLAPHEGIEPNNRVSLHLRKKEAAPECRLLGRIADPVTSFSGS